MFRFTIRELVLLTVVIGLGIGWSIDHERQVAANHQTEMRDWMFRAESLKGWIESDPKTKVEFSVHRFGQDVRVTSETGHMLYREHRLRTESESSQGKGAGLVKGIKNQ